MEDGGWRTQSPIKGARVLRNLVIVGNVASGKSTLTQLLATRLPNACAVPESFEENPFLPLYLQDHSRWALANAVRYYYDYARVFAQATAGHRYDFHVIDAGGASNRLIYGRYLLEEGVMTPHEYALYEILCNLIQTHFAYPEPDAYIFVRASPETCLARIRARSWDFQLRTITLKYLTALQKYIQALQLTVQASGIPALELSSETLDFRTAEGERIVLAAVHHFLEQHRTSR